MKKKKMLYLVLMAVIMVFITSPTVFAENRSNVRFTTQIASWKNNNDLRFACGSSTANITPTVYVATSLSDPNPTSVGCNFALTSLNLDDNINFYIIEDYDFASYNAAELELGTVTVNPGKVVSDSIASDNETVFGSYTVTDSEVVTIYVVNELDSNDVPTGNHYVLDAYFASEEEGGEKTFEKSFGGVYIPSYCINFHFTVKGNIANTYGTFRVALPDEDDTIISASHGDSTLVCELDESPLTVTQFNYLLNYDESDFIYTAVAREDEYVKAVENNASELNFVGDHLQGEVYFSATLSSDGSQTGLIYTVVPFILLVGFVGAGYIIIRKNQIQEQ